MYKNIFGYSTNAESCWKYSAKKGLGDSTTIFGKTFSSIFSHSKIKYLFSYVLALFINLTAVAAMIPVMEKISASLKSECVNTLKLLLLLERE